MRHVVLVLRLTLGVMFLVYGLNGLLHFFSSAQPTGDALTWMGIMAGHHWMNFVGVLELVAGLLLVVGRFVPLALTLLAPVIVNILLYHALLWPHGYVPALIVLALEVILLALYWRSFVPLFVPDPQPKRPNP